MAVGTQRCESNKDLLLHRGQTDSTSFRRMHKVEEQNKLTMAGAQNNRKIGWVNFIVHHVQKVYTASPPSRDGWKNFTPWHTVFMSPTLPAVKVIDR